MKSIIFRTRESGSLKNYRQRLFVGIAISLAVSLCHVMNAAADDPYFSDLLDAHWRVDLPSVNTAQAYFTYLQPANYLDNTPGTFTTGWLGIYLQPYIDGVAGSAKFTQIGTMSQNGQLFWFVESEAHLDCIQGTRITNLPPPLTGCFGDANSFVRLQQWNAVALYHYGTKWFANIQDYTGSSADVVAVTLLDDQGQVYDTTQIYSSEVASEEAYDTITYPNDPTVNMSYFFAHPQFYCQSAYCPSNPGFTDWVGSGSILDFFEFTRPGDPNAPPCLYGGVFNLSGDSRFWYTGNGGTSCSFVFP